MGSSFNPILLQPLESTGMVTYPISLSFHMTSPPSERQNYPNADLLDAIQVNWQHDGALGTTNTIY